MPSAPEKSKRRDQSLPGIGALTFQDFEAYRVGDVSVQQLADRVGTSRQAVASLFRRRRWSTVASNAKATPSTPSGVVASSLAPSASPVEIGDPAELHVAVANELARGDLLLLGVVVRSLQRWSDNDVALGAAQLKALAAAMAGLRGNLTLAGLAPTPDDERRPVELVVRMLTTTEEAEIRRQAEFGDELDNDDSVDDALDAPPEAADNAAHVPNELAPSSRTADKEPAVRIIKDPLPDAPRFEEWLEWLGNLRGNRVLRDIIGGLTGTVPRGDPNDLVKTIISLCDGDPRRLEPLT